MTSFIAGAIAGFIGFISGVAFTGFIAARKISYLEYKLARVARLNIKDI